MMTPGIRPGESPQFYKMDEYIFQNLCRDIFDAEPNIVSCDVYGVRGQSQDGIDLLAHRGVGDGIEVGQCKCYRSFSHRQINEVSDEFFKYWDRWSKENVKRFVLFVACDLNQRQQQDEILKQRKCFESYRVAYEVWSAAKIRNKLRQRPGIVASNFSNPEYWIRAICGRASHTSTILEQQSKSVVIVEAALISHSKELAREISDDIEHQLLDMVIAFREGHKDKAIKWIKNLKDNGSRWLTLSKEAKAKVLLLEANLELGATNNLPLVKKLADEAESLAPAINQRRLRALIARFENKPNVALELLADQEDIDSLNLRAAILLEMGRVDECNKILKFEEDELGIDGKA